MSVVNIYVSDIIVKLFNKSTSPSYRYGFINLLFIVEFNGYIGIYNL